MLIDLAMILPKEKPLRPLKLNFKRLAMKHKTQWTNHLLNFLSVILGVYIAFYINDRAKMNENYDESLFLKQSILQDLSDEIDAIESYQIPVNEKQQEDLLQLIASISNGEKEKIIDNLNVILQIENYQASYSTYNSIISSGKINLINDLDLQKDLIEFYESMTYDADKKNEIQYEFFKEELLPWVIQNIDLQGLKFLKTDEFFILQNKLIIYESLMAIKVKRYKDMAETSKALKEKIELMIGK